MIDSKSHLTIALLAGQVAKYALEFTESTQTSLLLQLRFKQLVDGVNALREAVQKAAADAKEEQSAIAQQAKSRNS